MQHRLDAALAAFVFLQSAVSLTISFARTSYDMIRC